MIRHVGIFLLFTISIFPQKIDSLKISLFLSTNLNNNTILSRADNNNTYKSDPTLGAGIEIFITKNEKGNNGGIGIEFQSNNSIIGINGNYNSLPIYFFYDISLGKDLSIYVPKLSLKLGYNILSATDSFIQETSPNNLLDKYKTSNGIYYALGISSQLSKSFMLRILYSVNQGKVNVVDKDYLLNNEKISIGLHIILKIL